MCGPILFKRTVPLRPRDDGGLPLEAFVARFMSLYKTYIVNMVSDDW